MSTCSQPVVTRIVVREEPDADATPYDFRTRFHWERFGQEVEIDDSEYVNPYGNHKFNFDDENHPIYTLQPGARLVIDSSDRIDKDDDTPIAERLRYLAEDASLIRRWQQNKWHYIGIVVEAMFEVTVTTETGYSMTFTDTESQSLWGIESGLSPYTEEQQYRNEIVKELTDELRSILTGRGIQWPDEILTQEVAA